jgi:hypothetical protein
MGQHSQCSLLQTTSSHPADDTAHLSIQAKDLARTDPSNVEGWQYVFSQAIAGGPRANWANTNSDERSTLRLSA